jgi:hypothetical protein
LINNLQLSRTPDDQLITHFSPLKRCQIQEVRLPRVRRVITRAFRVKLTLRTGKLRTSPGRKTSADREHPVHLPLHYDRVLHPIHHLETSARYTQSRLSPVRPYHDFCSHIIADNNVWVRYGRLRTWTGREGAIRLSRDGELSAESFLEDEVVDDSDQVVVDDFAIQARAEALDWERMQSDRQWKPSVASNGPDQGAAAAPPAPVRVENEERV